MSFQTAEIKVTPFLPMKGIYYIGQYGTSGYASAAKGYLYHYYSLGTPITWDPLYFDESELDDADPYNVVVKSLINKSIEHDFVILHSTPDLWPSFIKQKQSVMEGRILIGYCTWDTNRIPETWVKSINDTVHELWVPSEYNRQAFFISGVTKLIRVVPHVHLPPQPIERSKVSINDQSVYTFYTIGELNERKSIQETIETFCKTFTAKDRVRLLVKTHYRDYTAKNKAWCENEINDILGRFPDAPPVYAFVDNCTTQQIFALHTVGDCYLGLSKSEGFGLPIFDAHNLGKQIITTGYGGQLDFLKKDYAGLVRYTMGPAEGMRNYSGFDGKGQTYEWAIPDFDHAAQLMKKYYEESKNSILELP